MPADKTKMLKIITVVFALVAIAAIGFACWQLKVINNANPVVTTPRQTSPKPQAQKPTPKLEATPFVWPASSKATIGTLSKKKADLEELKLDVSIAEQKNKLNMLNKEPEAPMPTLVLPPAGLPPVENKVEANPAEAPKLMETTLIAIHGVDDDLTAVFSTPKGKTTVRVGDAILHSKVRSITLDVVTLTNGKVLQLGQDN